MENEEFQIYVVQEGDSLWKIARKFPDVSIKDIKEQNQLKSIRLQPGMELKIQIFVTSNSFFGLAIAYIKKGNTKERYDISNLLSRRVFVNP